MYISVLGTRLRKIMLNVHPQRWTGDYVPWVRELVGQNFKNIVKKWMIKFRN